MVPYASGLAGGLVSVFVDGLKGSLKPVVLDQRGHVQRVEAVCYATPPSGWLEDDDVQRTEVDFEAWLLEELAEKGAAKPRVLVRCEPQQMPEGQKVGRKNGSIEGAAIVEWK